ncbi:helix-turn-helix domain-containing protein [Halorubrum tebenquichense]|uniref:Bacterio-opsin activator HTH domain-containing protein n=1 Tax=Halorubrum tebenquichense DSM 14210 TaxID=1227485 RepID=M0DFD8_9EURY|nr:helix-turn-helix domain-containing protein [Halorubrum tebenquichense]ELZ32884.1 Bacterio-opsin activator HTH domain-containing protein [Halorubrum tebenquichense DSM 14210]
MGLTERSSTGEDDGTEETRRLYVEFELSASGAVACPVEDLGRDADRIDRQSSGGECHTEATREPHDKTAAGPGDAEIRHTKTEITSECYCPIFFEYDCIPKITDVTDEAVVIEAFLPDRDRLSALIDDLREATDEISLRRLTRIDSVDGDRSNRVTLDLSTLTEIEQETAAMAVASGYYETPRATSVGELAAELDITKSAMSQRLNSVESKLALAAFQ